MKYKAVLIGCGNIGSLYAKDPKIKGIYTHAGAYKACDKTELVAVCDFEYEKAVACAKQWAVLHCYSDVREMLIKHKPEIASICTSDTSHAEILELLLHTPGIQGVIVEKPLTLDASHAETLVNLAKKKNIVLVVNYNRRYAAGHQRIKHLINNGDLGFVQKISGYYTKGILHNGTHWLDLARWFIGEIKAVKGFNPTNSIAKDPPIDAWLKFENGTTGFLQNLDSNKYSMFEMDIVGTRGRIRITDSGHKIEFFHVANSEHYTGYHVLKKTHQENDNVSDTLLNVVYDLVLAIEDGKIPNCSGDDGLVVLRVATALIFSVDNKAQHCLGVASV